MACSRFYIDWRQQRYPLSWLPFPVRVKIAECLDNCGSANHGFEMFAHHLGFNLDQTANLQRIGRSSDFNYHPTVYLFRRLESRSDAPSIQDIYNILLNMRSAAADVILQHLPEIMQRQALHVNTVGQQNSEPSECGCGQCRSCRSAASNESTLCPGISRNTQSAQASDFQNVSQHLQDLPRHHPSHAPQQHSIRPNLPVNQTAGQSCVFRNPSNQMPQSFYPVRQISLPEGARSWIPPEPTLPPSLSSLQSVQPGLVSRGSQCSRIARSISELSHSGPSNSLASVNQSVLSSKIGRCESRFEVDDDIINCQVCRLAADPEQTVVLTPVSEPKITCSYHANRETSRMTNNVSYPKSSVQTSQEPNDRHESKNGNESFARLSGDFSRSVNGSERLEGQVNLRGDQMTLNMEVGEQTERKQYYQSNRLSNTDETARKMSYLDDISSERSVRGIHDCHDSRMFEHHQTEKKTSYLDNSGENFEGLVSDCPVCEQNRMKELNCRTPALCTCYSETNRPYNGSSPIEAQVRGCYPCGLQDAQRHVTGQSNEESAQRQGPDTIYERKRHSWHDGHHHQSNTSLRGSVSDSSIRSSESSLSSDSSSFEGSQCPGTSSKPVVLVHFSISQDQRRANAHLSEVYELIKMLKAAGFRVRVDMDRNYFRSRGWNRLDWLDKNLKKARFVVACISPEYADDIQPSDGPVAHVSQLNTRYIFDHMRKEYYDNQAQNRRLIPVLFPNTGAEYRHVPQCMTATKIYTYCIDVDEMIKIMHKANN